MRNTKIALAVLALVASTAAMAEGVTLYGTVDAGLGFADGKAKMYGGGNNGTTSFGITGSEDLGGGLKAGFNLQTGFTANNGQIANGSAANTIGTLFNRAAYVSLSNENVGLTLGNQFSNVVLQSGFAVGGNGVGGDGVNVPGVVRLFGGIPGGFLSSTNTATSKTSPGVFFIPQAVQASFNGGGIAGDVMYRVVDKTATNSGYMGATLRTSVAGINAGVGYQDVTLPGTSAKSMLVFANTQIADIRINGAYSRNTQTAEKDNDGYMVGASMPVAKDLSAGLSYSNNKAKGGSMTALSLDYALSKRTMVYGGFAQFSKAGGGQFANTADLSLIGKNLTTIGLKHSF